MYKMNTKNFLLRLYTFTINYSDLNSRHFKYEYTCI